MSVMEGESLISCSWPIFFFLGPSILLNRSSLPFLRRALFIISEVKWGREWKNVEEDFLLLLKKKFVYLILL